MNFGTNFTHIEGRSRYKWMDSNGDFPAIFPILMILIQLDLFRVPSRDVFDVFVGLPTLKGLNRRFRSHQKPQDLNQKDSVDA